jgi:hypothetical protein
LIAFTVSSSTDELLIAAQEENVRGDVPNKDELLELRDETQSFV